MGKFYYMFKSHKLNKNQSHLCTSVHEIYNHHIMSTDLKLILKTSENKMLERNKKMIIGMIIVTKQSIRRKYNKSM